MKCSSLLVLAALAAVNASIPGIAKKCNTNGQVALIVDALTPKDGPKLLEMLTGEEIRALIVIPNNILHNETHTELVKSVRTAGHELGYRIIPDGNVNLTESDYQEAINGLRRAKDRFFKLFGTNLKYVISPYTQDSAVEERIYEIVSDFSMIPIGPNLYLGRKEDEAKRAITKNLYSNDRSYIALAEGSIDYLRSIISYYKDMAIKHNFSLVSISNCLSGMNRIRKEDHNPIKARKTGRHRHHRHDLHRKKGKKSRIVKKNVVVKPEYIKGYSKKKKDAAKKYHNNKGRSGSGQMIQNHAGVKMYAKADKEFEMNNPTPLKLNGPVKVMNNKNEGGEKNEKKDDKKKEDEKTNGKDKVDAQDDSAANSLFGGINTIVLAIIVGLIAFF